MSWDAILSNPCLSHLTTDIFLRVDVETFDKLSQVCRAWRKHFTANELWKKKLLALAGPKSEFRSDVIDKALTMEMGKEDLSKLCRSLCLGHQWFDPEVRIAITGCQRVNVFVSQSAIIDQSGKAIVHRCTLFPKP